MQAAQGVTKEKHAGVFFLLFGRPVFFVGTTGALFWPRGVGGRVERGTRGQEEEPYKVKKLPKVVLVVRSTAASFQGGGGGRRAGGKGKVVVPCGNILG